jgi:nitrite reductase/ring-hydroxylating ferredoxin subunit
MKAHIMVSVRVGNLSDFPPGTVREIRAGGATYAVCNVEGHFYAVSGDCPHREGPLGHGALHEHQLVCPWHAWEFDVRTGECDAGPGCRIATYPASVVDGGIHIDIG